MFTFYGRCTKCGNELGTYGQCTNVYCNPNKVEYFDVGVQQGWQCPICKVVHAPWVLKCECEKQQPSVTRTTSNTDDEWKAIDDTLYDKYVGDEE